MSSLTVNPHFDTRYTAQERADIGRYAHQNGVTAAARHFSRLGHHLRESSIRSIRTAYREELGRKRKADGENIMILPEKKRGRSLLLGVCLDLQVQKYLMKVREGGGVVSARIAVAAARRILLASNRNMLAEFGGPVELNRHWAYSLFKRMQIVKRKASTAKSKHKEKDFKELKANFLKEVHTTVAMEEIIPELILNWDQTAIKIVPSSQWTIEKRGRNRVEMIAVDDKCQITAVFCGTLVGNFLPIQVIYTGKMNCCHPKYQFPLDWNVTHSPKHWSNEDTMVEYVEEIVIPYVEKTRENLNVKDVPALVIIDNFKGQLTSKLNSILEANNIHVCLLPPNTMDVLQPLDISVNKPAKDFLRDKFQEWYAEKVMDQIDANADPDDG